MDGWIANVLAMADLRPSEHVLVVADEPLMQRGADLARAARPLAGEVEVVIWGGERPLRQAPPGLVRRSQAAHVLFVVLSDLRGEEAGARFALSTAVTERGGRAVMLAGVDDAAFENELARPGPDVADSAQAMLDSLRGARWLRLLGAAGTDLLLDLDGRPWRTDAPPLRPGGFGSFPWGGVFCSPHRHGADGVLMVDASIPGLVNGTLNELVMIIFSGGRVRGVEGGPVAERLRSLIAKSGAGADVIAEVGFGINPACTPRGHLFIDEKSVGTAHVAIGRNTGAHGGHNHALIHVDCIFAVTEARADGRLVTLPV
jgi:leucyl aminopeptidase (aminopeptidase T)